jgi:hypothetical protein
MAEEADNPLGDLFVSLAPTIEEAHICGGHYQYQPLVISNLIEEFGFEINILVSLPPVHGSNSTVAPPLFQGKEQFRVPDQR